MKKNIYLGLDISKSSTGIAVMDQTKKILLVDVVISKQEESLFDVLNKLEVKVFHLLNKFSPLLSLIEAPLLSLPPNKGSIKTIICLNFLNLSIQNLLKKNNFNFSVVHPSTIRKEVYGNGKYSKEDIYMRNLKNYKSQILGKYKNQKYRKDISDAIACALYGISKS